MDDIEWDNDQPTDVDKWLALYAEDENLFWETDTGHHQNIIDELIYRLEGTKGYISAAIEFIDQNHVATEGDKVHNARSCPTCELLAYMIEDNK